MVKHTQTIRWQQSTNCLSVFDHTCIKSLNRYNLRHNNCIIFSIFLYFRNSFLSNSFIYKFVHSIIFLFIERKAISCLSVVAKNLPALELLNHFIKSSTVAYKRVAYKQNLVYNNHNKIYSLMVDLVWSHLREVYSYSYSYSGNDANGSTASGNLTGFM